MRNCCFNNKNNDFTAVNSVVASSCSNSSIIIIDAALDAAFSINSLLLRLIIE